MKRAEIFLNYFLWQFVGCFYSVIMQLISVHFQAKYVGEQFFAGFVIYKAAALAIYSQNRTFSTSLTKKSSAVNDYKLRLIMAAL